MSGKLAVIVLLACAVIAGAGLFWLEQFHWYDISQEAQGELRLTRPDGTPETLAATGLQIAEGASSPLKYRACFTLSEGAAALAPRFAAYEAPVPTVAPLTFGCFDAEAIAAALEAGTARAFLGTANITYGIDRVVAVTETGAGYAWHQINACGERVFDGDPPPAGCPPPPDPGN